MATDQLARCTRCGCVLPSRCRMMCEACHIRARQELLELEARSLLIGRGSSDERFESVESFQPRRPFKYLMCDAVKRWVPSTIKDEEDEA